MLSQFLRTYFLLDLAIPSQALRKVEGCYIKLEEINFDLDPNRYWPSGSVNAHRMSPPEAQLRKQFFIMFDLAYYKPEDWNKSELYGLDLTPIFCLKQYLLHWDDIGLFLKIAPRQVSVCNCPKCKNDKISEK